MTPTQKNIIGRITKLKSEIKELWTDCAILRAENERLRQERDELRRFAYEDAPRIAVKEANDQTADLRAEVERLRQELGYIANAQRKLFSDAEEFRTWAQSRARHAIGQKLGELTIKKGEQ